MTQWDAEGRPTEWVTATEPEWDAEDRALIYALLDYKADICRDCGQPLSESLHVAGQPDPQYESAFAVCVGCKVLERSQRKKRVEDEAAEKSGVSIFASARKWILTRVHPKQ